MSRKIPLICEMCDFQYRVPIWVSEAPCPSCGFPNDTELSGYSDEREEDSQ